MSKAKKDPCKANACRIQACLEANNFQENKCVDVLEQMRQCCLKWHKVSLCCSGIDLEHCYLVENKKSKEHNNSKERQEERKKI